MLGHVASWGDRNPHTWITSSVDQSCEGRRPIRIEQQSERQRRRAAAVPGSASAPVSTSCTRMRQESSGTTIRAVQGPLSAEKPSVGLVSDARKIQVNQLRIAFGIQKLTDHQVTRTPSWTLQGHGHVATGQHLQDAPARRRAIEGSLPMAAGSGGAAEPDRRAYRLCRGRAHSRLPETGHSSVAVAHWAWSSRGS